MDGTKREENWKIIKFNGCVNRVEKILDKKSELSEVKNEGKWKRKAKSLYEF